MNRRELIQLFAASPAAVMAELTPLEDPVGTLKGLVFTVTIDPEKYDVEVHPKTEQYIKEFLDKCGLSHIPCCVLCGMDVMEIRS